MEITVTIDDSTLDELARLIAEKIGPVAAAEEADDFDAVGDTPEPPKEPTLTDIQDSIKEAVGAFGKDKVKAMVKKITGVDMVKDIDKAKYQAVLDGIKKLKK